MRAHTPTVSSFGKMSESGTNTNNFSHREVVHTCNISNGLRGIVAVGGRRVSGVPRTHGVLSFITDY